MILSLNFAILTFFKSFLSNFLKHFRVGRYENLFIFFWKAIKIGTNKQTKKKKTGSVGLVETQVFFFFFFRPYLHHIAFDRLKSHTPFPCPASQLIFLKFQCVLCILNFSVANTFIRKESYFRINVHWDIINIKENNKGPRTVPSGTPDKTGAQSDFAPFTTTRCYLQHGKESIHLSEWVSRIDWLIEGGSEWVLEFLLFRLGSFSSIRAYIRDVTAAAGARKKSANQRSRFSN